jgi:Sporulation and spore germination
MIPRYQRILFSILVIGCIVLAVLLLRLRERAQDRLQSSRDETPMEAPISRQPENVRFLLANDSDGSLLAAQRSITLPADAPSRARVLLESLLAEYAKPNSTHPLPSGIAVEEVFLVDLPGPPSRNLAVVDLSTAFAQGHPSGIAPETLTLLSITGTLHANLPQISQVRFLVDGQTRDTLAGHADLTRTYIAANPDVEIPAAGARP